MSLQARPLLETTRCQRAKDHDAGGLTAGAGWKCREHETMARPSKLPSGTIALVRSGEWGDGRQPGSYLANRDLIGEPMDWRTTEQWIGVAVQIVLAVAVTCGGRDDRRLAPLLYGAATMWQHWANILRGTRSTIATKSTPTPTRNPRLSSGASTAPAIRRRELRATLTNRQVAAIRKAYRKGMRPTMADLAAEVYVKHQQYPGSVQERRPKQSGPVRKVDHRHSASDRDAFTGQFIVPDRAP